MNQETYEKGSNVLVFIGLVVIILFLVALAIEDILNLF